MIKILFIFLLVVFNSFAKANDPFTQEIGLIKEEPEVVEVIEEETEPETEEIVELENLIEDEEVIEETVIVKVVEKDNDVHEHHCLFPLLLQLQFLQLLLHPLLSFQAQLFPLFQVRFLLQ